MNETLHMNATVTLYSEITTPVLHWFVRDVEIDCEVEYDFDVENDGIGAYEYWGQRCYDAGTNYVGDVRVESVEFDAAALPWVLRNRWGVALVQRLFDAAAEAEAEDGQIRDAAEQDYNDGGDW